MGVVSLSCSDSPLCRGNDKPCKKSVTGGVEVKKKYLRVWIKLLYSTFRVKNHNFGVVDVSGSTTLWYHHQKESFMCLNYILPYLRHFCERTTVEVGERSGK